jgi:hypothetical protein
MDTDQHWAVADPVHATHFAPTAGRKVAFLQSVGRTLATTAAAQP